MAHFLPLHPLNVIQLVAPYLLPFRVYGGNVHESGLYAGAIPLVLLAWLFARRSELGQDRKLTLAVAAIRRGDALSAFGHYGLIYYVQTWLPIVGNFRVPARIIVLVNFSLAILAAIAFDKWTRIEKYYARSDARKDLEPGGIESVRDVSDLVDAAVHAQTLATAGIGRTHAVDDRRGNRNQAPRREIGPWLR